MPTRTAPTDNETFDLEVLLGVLSDVKVGGSAARMPVDTAELLQALCHWFPVTPRSRTRRS